MLVAEQLERGDQGAHQLQHRLQEADVDDLPDPGVDCGHRGERPHQGGDLVGQGDGGQQRPAIGLAVDAGETGHRLGQGGEPGPLGVGTVLAEAGHPGDDELRVLGDQVVGHQPERLELPGPEVLHDHVGGADQPTEHGDALGVLEVEHDAALAPTGELPEQGDVVGRVPPPH